METSVILHEKEAKFLSNFMKQNNLKSKAEAVRKCIQLAVNLDSRNDLLMDINNKLTRIIYRENIQKKLLKQFYANMEFRIDQDVKLNKVLLDFMKIIVSI